MMVCGASGGLEKMHPVGQLVDMAVIMVASADLDANSGLVRCRGCVAECWSACTYITFAMALL
jgi:hypothetical protein